MRFHSEGSIQELVRTIEKQRGKPDMTGVTGDIDDSGFRLFRTGGLSKRSFILVFKGTFRQESRRTTIDLKIHPHLTEVSISGTTKTVKKVDGSTTAATYTLNDAADPTSITRSS